MANAAYQVGAPKGLFTSFSPHRLYIDGSFVILTGSGVAPKLGIGKIASYGHCDSWVLG